MVTNISFLNTWVDLISKLSQTKDDYNSISDDEFAETVNNIYANEYEIRPLCRIYFKGDALGSDKQ
jgi:hypothetical protein